MSSSPDVSPDVIPDKTQMSFLVKFQVIQMSV